LPDNPYGLFPLFEEIMSVTSPSPRHLITGAAGFLGSHLSDALLAQGHHVTGVDSFITGSPENIAHLQGNKGFEFIEHDLTTGLPERIAEQASARASKRFDRIWHLASPASPVGYVKHQVQTLKVNSTAAMELLELAEAHKARIFVASTSECYGDPLEHPQKETYWGHVNSIGMRSMYDEAKRFMEAATMAYHRERGVDTRIVRIFNTYGPRLAMNDGRVVVAFITQALRGEPLTVQGEGLQTRSLCFVEDEIRGFLALMESDYHLPVNVGNPDEVTMLELAKEIRELCGSKSEIVHTPLPPDDPKQRCPDISLARKLLGWEPRVARVEGLRRTIEFYRERVISGDGKGK
jgi:dTDP-glucose 4,6-dehydratase